MYRKGYRANSIDRSRLSALAASRTAAGIAEAPHGRDAILGGPIESALVLQERNVLGTDLLVAADAEPNDADPLTLEVGDRMCEISIEDQGPLLDVELLRGLLRERLQGGLLVIFVPVEQLTAGVFAESADRGGPRIVRVPVDPSTIVRIDVDRSADNILGEAGGAVVEDVLVEQPGHSWVAARRRGDPIAAGSAEDAAQCVAVDPLPPTRQDVYAVAVLREAPEAEDLVDVVLAEFHSLFGLLLQRLQRQLVRYEAPVPGVRRLVDTVVDQLPPRLVLELDA
mmetsp:Transcript_94348/g.184997  ORF Transcript_94348/g.184997 Transcript_94348/m.184997 type:complete len:283 (-) Transcript_94348:484-1332(-)